MAKDCCAANFERAVFRYDRVVALAKDFDCVKFSVSGDASVFTRFNLDSKKPAILLLDAEGGLIDKQQKCVDPGKYSRVVKNALELNRKRLEFRSKFLGQHEEMQKLIDAGHFGKALTAVERALGKRDLLMGDVERRIIATQGQLEKVGREMFARAVELEAGKSYLDALELFKTVKQEFARLDDLERDAAQRVRDLTRTLRDLGVTVR
ncbi:MAG: hypothetical protein AB7O52_01625 [Planctomycetota bacterium]